MNTSIARLFTIVIVLFGALIAWTSRWTVFESNALQSQPLNELPFFASLKVKRGRILADNGAVLAKSVPAHGGLWNRKYPLGPLFAQPIGYSILTKHQQAGLEEYRAKELGGTLRTGLSSVFGPISTQTIGDDVFTTLDPRAQQLAKTELAGRVGSVVAIVPQTGAVRVMYSNPSYDNNNPFAPCSDSCQYNRATQALYPPGSTFKVVTSAAALNSGVYTPDSIINGDSPITVSGVPLSNDSGQSWGPITLRTALTNSVNTVFAQVGLRLGRQTMQTYMKRFGFYSTPPLDYPSNQINVSGNWHGGKLVPVTSDQVDLGRMSIGQAKLLVTPLQMAMVAAAVANHGRLMKPRLTTKVVNHVGQVVERVSPQTYSQVMKPSIATELTQMMTDVVEEGTGQSAQLGGVQVAGKTGTASTGGFAGGQPLDDAWFIGFAPVQDPKIAVAVTLENIPNGYGGVYAAPIAAQEIKTLLAETK